MALPVEHVRCDMRRRPLQDPSPVARVNSASGSGGLADDCASADAFATRSAACNFLALVTVARFSMRRGPIRLVEQFEDLPQLLRIQIGERKIGWREDLRLDGDTMMDERHHLVPLRAGQHR